jgi:hypothetical protein
MKQLNILIFILVFLAKAEPSIAQTGVNGAKESNKNLKIAVNDIDGNWYPTDSIHATIRFVIANPRYMDMEGIQHGVGNYGFPVNNDSISVNGMAPNWPPYDCTLRLINNKRLEISFSQFFIKESYKVIYKR